MTGSLADRFEAVVDAHGSLAAVHTGDTIVTFDELDRRANRVAHWLGSNGVGVGDRVGLALWNRIEHLDLLLGAFKAGAIPVNVNCRYTAAETEALLVDANPRVVVHEPTSTMTITDASQNHGWSTIAIGHDYDAAVDAMPSRRPDVIRSGDDHYLLYTGGSTGTPKGVLWQQGDLYSAAMSGADTRRPGSRMLPASPLTHGTAQWSTLSTLFSAGTIVFGPQHGLDTVALWTRVAEAEVSRLIIVGDAFARPMLDTLDAEPDRWDLSSLVAIASGGARWSIGIQLGLLEHLPQAAMVNSFGATETGGQGSQVRFAGDTAGSSTAGLLCFEPDETAVVLDDGNQEVRPGSSIVGRLARRGPTPLGYFNDPDRTAQVFPVIRGVRHAIPGDLAKVAADGTIVVLGRERNVINTGGEKVFAEEVEARLMVHPVVSQAVVVGLTDDRWGERIGALVTVADHGEVTHDDLVTHCAATLARFKIPRRIEIVESIRHLPNGKLDRAWAADTMARIAP